MLTVIQEMTSDGPRDELSRVNINIHEDRVFGGEEIK